MSACLKKDDGVASIISSVTLFGVLLIVAGFTLVLSELNPKMLAFTLPAFLAGYYFSRLQSLRPT